MTTHNSKPKVEVLPDDASTPFDDKTNSNSDSGNSNSSKKETTNEYDTPIEENSNTIKAVQFVYAKQYIENLKAKSNEKAIEFINSTPIMDIIHLGQLILHVKTKDWMKKELGEKVGNHLIHIIASNMEAAGRQFDSSRTIQSLEENTEGYGVYAQTMPSGLIGAEIGVVKGENKDNQTVTRRVGVGMYINFTATSLYKKDSEEAAKMEEAMDELFRL